jgi:hypothetical protein
MLDAHSCTLPLPCDRLLGRLIHASEEVGAEDLCVRAFLMPCTGSGALLADWPLGRWGASEEVDAGDLCHGNDGKLMAGSLFPDRGSERWVHSGSVVDDGMLGVSMEISW